MRGGGSPHHVTCGRGGWLGLLTHAMVLVKVPTTVDDVILARTPQSESTYQKLLCMRSQSLRIGVCLQCTRWQGQQEASDMARHRPAGTYGFSLDA